MAVARRDCVVQASSITLVEELVMMLSSAHLIKRYVPRKAGIMDDHVEPTLVACHMTFFFTSYMKPPNAFISKPLKVVTFTPRIPMTASCCWLLL
eukprot:CAMPEP_0174711142 /NCGR_PEP_ID=MMETSP1094-20130205/12547_1 /TAXON_ID=156173 /ORGANISM="Chrysochromulina brevifilum, Strain UTEX LB 985" /LENGTH=94 /DNA_ID=CAMNT_0015910035 /DNA_START=1176 /DNA_END=1461 /DNA_ORIENTATION=+